MVVLPRGYISYSQLSLWKRDKNAYRTKYYGERQPEFENVETIFGKKVHEILENKNDELKDYPLLHTVKRHSSPEHAIEVMMDDVMVFGKIDSFDEELLSFIDFKTGHAKKDGSAPWNDLAVRKHEQLPFYSAMIEEKYGKVHNLCHLIWIETAFKNKEMEFDGHILSAESRDLELTGRIETFARSIPKWERKRMRELIIKTAHEISEDYHQQLLLKSG